MPEQPQSAQQPPPPPVQPAGWYHDGVAQRWWDGASWGPYAPVPTTNSNDKMMSMAAHAGPLVGLFVVPLVFYLVAKEEGRPETRWHAREALNFQLTFLIVYLGSFGAFFVAFGLTGAFSAAGPENSAAPAVGFGLSFFVFFIVAFVAMVLNWVFSVIGAIKANKGIRWKYPIRIPFVRA